MVSCRLSVILESIIMLLCSCHSSPMNDARSRYLFVSLTDLSLFGHLHRNFEDRNMQFRHETEERTGLVPFYVYKFDISDG